MPKGDELRITGAEVQTFIREKKIPKLVLHDRERSLGEGSFGTVFPGTYHNIPIVLKVEIVENGKRSTLKQEYEVYKQLCQVVDITNKNWKLTCSAYDGTPKCFLYVYDQGAARVEEGENTKTGKKRSPSLSSSSYSRSASYSSSYSGSSSSTSHTDDIHTSTFASTRLNPNQSIHILVMSRMGDNLKMLQKKMKGRFSLATVTMLAISGLEHLKYMHTHGIVHRDIKPANIMISYNNPNDSFEKRRYDRQCIYLADFGLSKAYVTRDKKGEYHHIPKKEYHGAVGTAYYMGWAAHKGIEASRRDDLQSLAYVILHCYHGALPWTKLTHEYNRVRKELQRQKQRNNKHRQKLEENEKRKLSQMLLKEKQSISADRLCKGLPLVFKSFVQYVKQLNFHETPNYVHWIEQFQSVLTENNWDIETTPFDWCVDEVRREQRRQPLPPKPLSLIEKQTPPIAQVTREDSNIQYANDNDALLRKASAKNKVTHSDPVPALKLREQLTDTQNSTTACYSSSHLPASLSMLQQLKSRLTCF